MALKRCEAGHYYDPQQHSSCPHCGIPGLNIDPTMPVKNPIGTPDAFEAKTEPMRPDPGPTDDQDRGGTVQRARRPADEGKTVGLIKKKLGIDPVVGWLVCIAGPDRGRDYRVRSGRNFIGRGQSMHIAIMGDNAISREKHAVISYDPRKNWFKIAPGDGAGMVYLNDDAVDVPMALKAHDIVELGETTLIFIPFCGEHFQWNTESS